MPPQPRTMYDKVWSAHEVVAETPDAPAVLAIDLHLIHEVTSPQAFSTLRDRGLRVRDTSRTLATMDHSTPTVREASGTRLAILDDKAEAQLAALRKNCEASGVTLHGVDSDRRGIVHVMGPELGATQPGMTVVCGDSHTSTHGAFGCLAFGIGTSEVAQALATQCLLQRRSKTMAVEVTGRPSEAATAKDLILAIVSTLGVSGGTAHVLEYRGQAIRDLSMEGRMTVCNMSIEAGARAGMIAPDNATFAWLEGREHVPSGEAWNRAVARWSTLPSDEGAAFDRTVEVDVDGLGPMVTWGTTPAMAAPVGGHIPDPRSDVEAQSLAYMDLEAGTEFESIEIDIVFIGSCTNARLSDLRAAASVLRGRKVAPNVTALIVPGSERVKAEAEAEGLDEVFIAAGCQWREPGCSMCIAMNGDIAGRGARVVSTSNRNFEGRQGPGSRTVLASPLTAAASAVTGRVTDPRSLMREPAMAGGPS